MSKKIRVLVLGSSGMLGFMVENYLTRNPSFEIIGTTRKADDKNRFDAEEFVFGKKQGLDLKSFDYIINCVGIIKPFCQDNDPEGVERAIKVNALFPHKLSQAVKGSEVKVLQIATDCVYSGKKGSYVESDKHDALDVYGKTKSLGEVFADNNFLNIRCSIIGPENGTSKSLLEWFLHQEDKSKLKGFEHHKWNGVTTLQFAKLCEKVMVENKFSDLREINHLHHFIPNSLVSKYELLKIFKEVFNKSYEIEKVDDIGEPVDRSLDSNYKEIEGIYGQKSMKEALLELKEYMDEGIA